MDSGTWGRVFSVEEAAVAAEGEDFLNRETRTIAGTVSSALFGLFRPHFVIAYRELGHPVLPIDRDTAPGPGVFPGESHTRMDCYCCQHIAPHRRYHHHRHLPPTNAIRIGHTHRKTLPLRLPGGVITTSPRLRENRIAGVKRPCLSSSRRRRPAQKCVSPSRSFADERVAVEEGARAISPRCHRRLQRRRRPRAREGRNEHAAACTHRSRSGD